MTIIKTSADRIIISFSVSNPPADFPAGWCQGTSLFSGLMPELLAKYITVYRNDIIQRDDRPVLHYQRLFRDGNVPYPAGHGHIRAASLPVIGNEVFDGHFRTLRQPGGKFGETAVQFFGLLRVQFAPFGGQPGSSPYCRIRQSGDTRKMKNGWAFIVKSELS